METWQEKTMRHNPQIDDACARGICGLGSNLGHMPRIYHICTKLKPRVIVETGMGTDGHGSSTYTFLIIAKEMNAHVWTIDNESEMSHGWFQKKFPEMDYTCWTFIKGDSVQILKELPEEAKQIDFLHLDSGHSFEHVTAELNAAKPYLAEVCVITTHDTEQKDNSRKGICEWANENGYTIKEFSDWHGQVFITKNPELFEGLV